MTSMFCHVCLSEKVRGEIDQLVLCDECIKKIEKYWDKDDVNRY